MKSLTINIFRRRISLSPIYGAIALGVVLVVALLLMLGRQAVKPDIDGFAVRGVDISAHNGNVDFDALRDAGYSFAFIKASEGTDFKDVNFVDNYRKAKAAGLAVGAYHFFRFDVSGEMQALNLINSIRGRELDLPLVVDVEEWQNAKGDSTDEIVRQLSEMVATLEDRGYAVMIYTNKDGYARFVRGKFDNLPLWICSLSDLGSDDISWAFWQHSHTQSIDGISGRIDANVFNGSAEEFTRKINDFKPKHNKPQSFNVIQ